MKKIFQKWLLIVVSAAFLLTFLISYYVHTRQARRGAAELIQLKLADAESQLSNSAARVEQLIRIYDSIALLKARLFAEKLRHTPAKQADLGEWRELLDVEELYIVDGDGTIANTSDAKDRGKNIRDIGVSADFVTALGRNDFARAATLFDPEEKLGMLQHAALSRLDAPGLVGVIAKSEQLKQAIAIADIDNFAEGFRIGSHGGMLVGENDVIVCDGMLDIPGKTLSELGFTPKMLRSSRSFDITLHGVDYVGLAARHKKYTIVGLLPDSEVYYRRNVVQSVLVIVYLLLFSLIFVLITVLISRIVLSGIDKVCSSLARITAGDLEEKVNVHNSVEFDVLSRGINSTVGALKEAVADAARRLDNELILAKAIQDSALPRQFPPFPDHYQFDIYASMEPAREVGGDFFDFFLVGDRCLAFLVADVSEKGIPAALFMMSGKTWLKSLAAADMEPARVFTEANKMLCLDNDPGMFITAFFARLDLESGELLCVNAGHNPPLLRRADGKFEYLKLEPDFILGTLPDVEYHQHRIMLCPGDRLFLYTDGVTEAETAHGEFYGTDRLREALDRRSAETLEETVRAIHGELAAFSTEQSDDITMLALDFHGRKLTLEAELRRLPELQGFLDRCARSAGLPEAQLNRLQVAAEEIFLNIASYAYAPEAGGVRVEFEPEPGGAAFAFRDSGKPFNPLDVPEPDFSEELDDRPVGGLGIHVAKNLADRFEYSRKDGVNHTRIQFKI